MVSFPQGFSNSPTPTRCPTIQFSSDSACPELAPDSVGLRDQSCKAARTSGANNKYRVPRLPSLLSDLATEWGFSIPHSHIPHPKLRKVLYLRLLVYCEGYNSGTARWRRHLGRGVRGGAWSFHAFSQCATLPAS